MERLKSTEFINDLKDIIIDSGVIEIGAKIRKTKNENIRIIEGPSGDWTMKQIHAISGINGYSIEECVLKEKTMSYKHRHDVAQWLIVITGKAYVKIEAEKGYFILTNNNGIKIPPNVLHHVLCPVETKILSIFIPSAEEFTVGIVKNGLD